LSIQSVEQGSAVQDVSMRMSVKVRYEGEEEKQQGCQCTCVCPPETRDDVMTEYHNALMGPA
jgi:hypothetical protein